MQGFLKFLKVLVVCILIEVLVLDLGNAISMVKAYQSGDFNQTIPLEKCEMINWVQMDNKMVSTEDPMLIYEPVDRFVNEVKLLLKSDEYIKELSVFYEVSINDHFETVGPIKVEQFKDNEFIIPIGERIHLLRIDIGELAGTVIYDCKIVLNPIYCPISLSRIVAMLIIYYVTSMLFKLNESPDYGIKID